MIPALRELTIEEAQELEEGLSLASRLANASPPLNMSQLQRLYDDLLGTRTRSEGSVMALGFAFGMHLMDETSRWVRAIYSDGAETVIVTETNDFSVDHATDKHAPKALGSQGEGQFVGNSIRNRFTETRGTMTITVFIPTQLRNYTNGATQVPANGTTVDEALTDLDTRHPGLRFRIIDEQNRIRQHMRIFVDGERALTTSEQVRKELHVFGALTGG